MITYLFLHRWILSLLEIFVIEHWFLGKLLGIAALSSLALVVKQHSLCEFQQF